MTSRDPFLVPHVLNTQLKTGTEVQSVTECSGGPPKQSAVEFKVAQMLCFGSLFESVFSGSKMRFAKLRCNLTCSVV